MNCPRCGNKDQENNEICSNCGLKLRINCPQCGNSNSIRKERCESCSERLIIFCPQCRVANHPKANKCRKCDASFAGTEEQAGYQSHETANQNYAVIAIELTNLTNLKARLEPDVFLNLIDKFYKIIINEAKGKKEKAKRITQQLLAIEFKNSNPERVSAICSVVVAQHIMEEIKVLNKEIRNEAELELNIKIGISLANDQTPKNFCQNERTIGSSGEIIVNSYIHTFVSDLFDFEEIKLPNNEASYKLMEYVEYPINSSGRLNIPYDPSRRERVESLKEKDSRTRKVNTIAHVSQEKAYNSITNILNKEQKGIIIGIAGEDGVGKTTILSSIRQSIPSDMTFVMIQCQPVNRVIPFGFCQDLFKTLLNLPQLILNINDTKKAISQFLENISAKNRQTEKVLNKLLLQEFLSTQISELFSNYEETAEAIKSILTSLITKSKIILAIDDIEYIDKASMELIKSLINNGSFLAQGNHIIATHCTGNNLNDYLLYPNSKVETIKYNINPLTRDEMEKALFGMLNNHDILPDELKDEIFNKSKGSPLYIEQVVWLLFQTGIVYTENNYLKFNEQGTNMEFPENLEEILKTRLTQINEMSSDLLNIVLAASLFGQRFMPSMVQLMLNTEQQQFNEQFQALIANGIFVNYDNISFLIKHRLLWDIIYNHLLSADQKNGYHQKAMEALKNYTKSNAAIIALQAELAQEAVIAIEYWNQAAIEALSLGDSHAFTIAQKKVLNLMDIINVPKEDRDRLKQQIYEQLGKISYEINPEEAMDFLSNAVISREKQENVPQVIELTGYLSKSCEILGNYSGIVECVDKALASINKQEMPLEHALLCYSKLKALYNLGKFEETIMLAKTSVIPVLRTSISSKTTVSDMDLMELQYIELDAELTLIRTLAAQGNKEILNIVDQVATKAKDLGFIDIETQVRLAEALFKCLQGRIKSCNNTLSPIKGVIPVLKDNETARIKFNTYSILLKIFCGNYSRMSHICCQSLDLAKEYREYNLYAIIKLLTAKVLKETGKSTKARSLYNEIIAYCSEHKMATGALLGWYLIAESEIDNRNPEVAREIAQRALEVAQKADINNHFFIALLQKIIAQTYIVTEDYDSAKMYIQKALEVAKKMELYYLQSKLYLIYGKMFREIIEKTGKNKEAHARNANKLYLIALQIAKMIENSHLEGQIEDELSDLKNLVSSKG